MATTPIEPGVTTPVAAPAAAPVPRVPRPTTPTPTVTTYAPLASPVPTRLARGTRTPPPTRLAYTRHATTGTDDDRIVASALVTFWKIMAWAGGIALLSWILFGGFQWGRAAVPVVPIATPVAAPSPISVATPPAPVQPQVIIVPVPQPVQQVAYPPETPAVNQLPQQVESRPLTDGEQRNEALKERLRRRYGLSQ